MPLVIAALVSLTVLTHVLWIVFTDDPSRHHAHYSPPRSHAPDAFEAGAHHRDLAA